MALAPAHVVQGAAASPGGLLETSISASVCIRTCVFNKTLQVICMTFESEKTSYRWLRECCKVFSMIGINIWGHISPSIFKWMDKQFKITSFGTFMSCSEILISPSESESMIQMCRLRRPMERPPNTFQYSGKEAQAQIILKGWWKRQLVGKMKA